MSSTMSNLGTLSRKTFPLQFRFSSMSEVLFSHVAGGPQFAKVCIKSGPLLHRTIMDHASPPVIRGCGHLSLLTMH